MTQDHTFQFGIYAGSVSGTASGLAVGPVDNMQLVTGALDDLQQAGPPILIRAYLHYRGAADWGSGDDLYSQHFRDQMAIVSLSPECPIVITENGWPTGSGRPERRQSEVLEIEVKTVYAYREQFNVRGYQWFALRDADSGRDDLFHQFGLLHSDYSRKPSFDKFGELIGRLSSNR